MTKESRSILFHKMQGAGNDFVVIDNREGQYTKDEIIAFTPALCDRKFGIGADGLMALNAPEMEGCDFTMYYRNADGSDAGMCGNGARCLSLFAARNGFPDKVRFNVHGNIYSGEVHEDGSVSVHFPVRVQPESVKLRNIDMLRADTGTEHVIHFVNEKEIEDEELLIHTGRKIRYHEDVNPPGTNVNFVCPNPDGSLQLQTYERGVEGLTLACGTGALASAVALHHREQEKESHAEYSIHVKGGTLHASFYFDEDSGTYDQLILNGPAHFVFKGNIEI